MRTILLALNTWDLTLDSGGNIAVAEEPYAPAQDAASACRVFQGEVWYDNTIGIPYLEQILGHFPASSYVKAQLEAQSLSVPDVAVAKAFLTSFNRRVLGTQVQLTLTSGATAVLAAQALQGPLPWYIQAASPQAAGSLEGGP